MVLKCYGSKSEHLEHFCSVKMLYLIGPDGHVNQGFVNFQKVVWMTMVQVIHIHAVFWKFGYARFTRYAEYIRFCHEKHLKLCYSS